MRTFGWNALVSRFGRGGAVGKRRIDGYRGRRTHTGKSLDERGSKRDVGGGQYIRVNGGHYRVLRNYKMDFQNLVIALL